ncbi:hypothetical protein I8748_13555 [Nostoc sp. CENA67]|uniref:VWFA domain-containing protein n=1 Tax=Amazonocrinis nigriterrae CENA67 TaxID=2794033 RepID=A0A8J7L8B6_9NOST|nr:hypothetical protein [Amazonocrinis nigriterrae]MBH8563198.1 hypothetical protein [Amazonocrinis nigriterrae CENA67]
MVDNFRKLVGAFLLVETGLILFSGKPAIAFKLTRDGHLGITSDAVKPISVTIDSKTLQFSDKALDQIIKANKATDSFIFPNNQAKAEFHFDDESFLAATTRILDLKQEVIDNITKAQPDGSAARQALGGALHTIQDFYAHSNWVELGNTGIDTRLGRSTFAGLPLTTPTSPAGDPSTLLPGLTDLTSGYFVSGGITRLPCAAPAGKTNHGGIPIACPEGLNKDDRSRPGFPQARDLAVQASSDFIDQILQTPGVKNEFKPVQALMGLTGTLGFVIDTTGSMGSVIGQVKNQVTKAVDKVKDKTEVPEYLLETFNDPDVGTPFVTQDPKTLVAAVNSLGVGGGGDCPELSMTGTLRAVEASLPNSNLFVFTDASSKDGDLSSQVAAKAGEKNTKVNFLLNGSCSPIDPAYVEVAQQTGGQLFSVDTFEISSAFDLIEPYLSSNLTSVLSANGTLNEESKSFDVPIDSTVSSSSISVSTSADISLVRPDGTEVQPGDTDVTVTTLSTGRIFTINSPKPGIWKLKLQGSGEFSVSAQVDSPIQLDSFQFVKREIESVHGGLFPTTQEPIANSEFLGLAKLFGSFNTANFKLISETGDTIQLIDLLGGDPEATDSEFVGKFKIPTTPFKIAVDGLDQNNQPYQRVLPRIFIAAPQTVPESSSTLGLFIFGAIGVAKLQVELKRHLCQK